MKIAVGVGILLIALVICGQTVLGSAQVAAKTETDDRAFAAAVLGETGPDATSAELIDAAVSRGELSSEQGLLYGVYLACEPDRLPARFRGQDTESAAADVLWEAHVDWAALSPDTQSAFREFFAGQMAADVTAPCAEHIRQMAGEPETWWRAAIAGQDESAAFAVVGP